MDEVVEWIPTEERGPEVGRVVAVIYAPSSLVRLVRVAHRVPGIVEPPDLRYWRLHEEPAGIVTRQDAGIVAWCPLPPIPKGSLQGP